MCYVTVSPKSGGPNSLDNVRKCLHLVCAQHEGPVAHTLRPRVCICSICHAQACGGREQLSELQVLTQHRRQVEVRASVACTWLGFLFFLTGSCCGHCATGHPCKLPSEGGGCCCCVSFFVSCKQAALKACASCWCIPFMWYGLCTCGGGHMQRIPGGVALTIINTSLKST